MRRALHVFPAFTPESGVQAFRVKHDPLAFCIPPHITLLFPFEDGMEDEALIEHIEQSVGSQKRFTVGFSEPIAVGTSSLWLPVLAHREKLVGLHARLYQGIMRTHLRPEYPYRPHVTLGESSEADLVNALKATRDFRLEASYSVDRLILERIGAEEHSDMIAEIKLK